MTADDRCETGRMHHCPPAGGTALGFPRHVPATLRRTVTAGAALLALVSCATPLDTDPRLLLTDACDAFAAGLTAAAELRAAGLLSPAAVARIDAAIPSAQALCLTPPPTPAGAAAGAAVVTEAAISIAAAEQEARP